jgi:hypothetical protein
MIEGPVPAPSASDWSDALLTSGTESLLGAVRNYIGPVKTPYDKRDLVAKLEAFLRRAETKESLLSLLDAFDVKILGSSILVGPVTEQALKDLFAGELPLFELGVRISNLLDRLLLFRYQAGGRRLVAVNPLLSEELRARTTDPKGLFGQEAKDETIGGKTSGSVADAKAAVALFAFLFHSPLSTRKGGGLTKRGTERAAALLPGLAAAVGDRPGVLARALTASGILSGSDEEDRGPDHEIFARLLADWGEYLPFYLTACLVVGRGAARALAFVLSAALESLSADIVFTRSGLARWLRIVARISHFDADPAAALPALEELGILSPCGNGLALVLPQGEGVDSGPAQGILVVEGAHALHLMPEAGLADRLFVGCVARPVSVGTVWSFEVDRDTVRRALAAGFSASTMKSRFESMSGTALPQSFVFSLSAWEEEYRSLRLYRGFTLIADARLQPIIERSGALGKIVAERLAPGVYFLSAVTSEEAAAALAAAGLDVPPLTQGGSSPGWRSSDIAGESGAPWPTSASSEPGARSRIESLRDSVSILRRGESSVDGDVAHGMRLNPERRLAELRAYLMSSGRSEEERRELSDRIERRLVLTERQIAQSDPKPERLEAGGLDYLGKVRIVERALRTVGDRLEVLYRLPGAEPVRALLRPVRLDKNEKGLVLEAEDLGTGGPARVPLGAVSTVRRVRASLFGEEQ